MQNKFNFLRSSAKVRSARFVWRSPKFAFEQVPVPHRKQRPENNPPCTSIHFFLRLKLDALLRIAFVLRAFLILKRFRFLSGSLSLSLEKKIELLVQFKISEE